VRYFTPSGEIPRRVEIGVGRMATPQTGELGLTPAIPLLDKATVVAGTTGVPWIN
jgi:hypothetical protein